MNNAATYTDEMGNHWGQPPKQEGGFSIAKVVGALLVTFAIYVGTGYAISEGYLEGIGIKEDHWLGKWTAGGAAIASSIAHIPDMITNLFTGEGNELGTQTANNAAIEITIAEKEAAKALLENDAVKKAFPNLTQAQVLAGIERLESITVDSIQAAIKSGNSQTIAGLAQTIDENANQLEAATKAIASKLGPIGQLTDGAKVVVNSVSDAATIAKDKAVELGTGAKDAAVGTYDSLRQAATGSVMPDVARASIAEPFTKLTEVLTNAFSESATNAQAAIEQQDKMNTAVEELYKATGAKPTEAYNALSDKMKNMTAISAHLVESAVDGKVTPTSFSTIGDAANTLEKCTGEKGLAASATITGAEKAAILSDFATQRQELIAQANGDEKAIKAANTLYENAAKSFGLYEEKVNTAANSIKDTINVFNNSVTPNEFTPEEMAIAGTGAAATAGAGYWAGKVRGRSQERQNFRQALEEERAMAEAGMIDPYRG